MHVLTNVNYEICHLLSTFDHIKVSTTLSDIGIFYKYIIQVIAYGILCTSIKNLVFVLFKLNIQLFTNVELENIKNGVISENHSNIFCLGFLNSTG